MRCCGGDFGDLAGVGKFFAQRAGGDASALVHQQEVDRCAGAGVRQRPAGSAAGGDPVEDRHGLVVEWDHPFGCELAQRHFQPGAVSVDLVHAVQFQVT